MKDLPTKGIVPCVECGARYSPAQIGNGLLHLSTLVCHKCYLRFQALPATESCFGKADQYDINDSSCYRYCPDRNICPKYMDSTYVKQIELMEDARKRVLAFLQATDRARRKAPRSRKGSAPFVRGTLTFACYEKLLKGMTIQEFRQYCKVLGTPYTDMRRTFAKGCGNGYLWKWIEEEGRCQILFVRPTNV